MIEDVAVGDEDGAAGQIGVAQIRDVRVVVAVDEEWPGAGSRAGVAERGGVAQSLPAAFDVTDFDGVAVENDAGRALKERDELVGMRNLARGISQVKVGKNPDWFVELHAAFVLDI